MTEYLFRVVRLPLDIGLLVVVAPVPEIVASATREGDGFPCL
jgi:hypothetical protein